MRSRSLDLGGTSIRRPGTLIGKALDPPDKSTGEILVLLSLQYREDRTMMRTRHSVYALMAWMARYLPVNLIWILVAFSSSASAQSPPNIQYTHNVADSTMRSDVRVDPSSLGVNIQIPLRGYPGRAGVNLPVALYYSSKVWRMNHQFVYQDIHGNYHTTSSAYYAESSAAGWTSSLGIPWIERTGANQLFDKFALLLL